MPGPALVPLIQYGLPAIVGAGASIAGGKMQSNAAKRAAASTAKSQADALAFERERQAVEDQRYNDRWQDYLTRHRAWEQRNFGAGNTTTTSGRQSSAAAPMTIGQMAGAPTGAAPVSAQPDVRGPMTIGDMAQGEWSDWRNYLGGV